jgi:hypothetical protein
MFYVLIKDGKIKHYRKILADLMRDCEINGIEYSEIVEVEKEPVFVNGNFYFAGEAPAEEYSAELAAEVRAVRNQYLAETDKYMIPDFPVTEEERQQYKDYRVYLRNYPETEGWYEHNPLTFEEWKQQEEPLEQAEPVNQEEENKNE